MKVRASMFFVFVLIVSGCSSLGGSLSGLEMSLDVKMPTSCLAFTNTDKTNTCSFYYLLKNSSKSAIVLKGEALFVEVDGKTFQAKVDEQWDDLTSANIEEIINPGETISSGVIFNLPAGHIGQLWIGAADRKDAFIDIDRPVLTKLTEILGFWDRASNNNADFGSGLWLKVTQTVESPPQYLADFIQDDGNLNPSIVASATLSGTSKSFQLTWVKGTGKDGIVTQGRLDGNTLKIDCTNEFQISNNLFNPDQCTFIHGASSLGDYGLDFSGFATKELKSVDSNGNWTGLTLSSQLFSDSTSSVPMYLETIKDRLGNEVAHFYLADLGDTAAHIWWDDSFRTWGFNGSDVTYVDWGHTGSGTRSLSVDCGESPYFLADIKCDFRDDYTY